LDPLAKAERYLLYFDHCRSIQRNKLAITHTTSKTIVMQRTLAARSLLVLGLAWLTMDCSSSNKPQSNGKDHATGGRRATGGNTAPSGGDSGTSETAGAGGTDGMDALGGTSNATGGFTMTVDTSVPKQPWDWSGVIGSGQSLAVGEKGTPVVTTTQPYHNLKLSTGTLAWPVDPNSESLTTVPLIEPVGRLKTGYPSSWPTNITGETAHSSMANQITAMVAAANGGDYVGVHGEFGENGQSISYLVKNAPQNVKDHEVNGRAYAATLIETQAITRLARAQGKTYGVGAFIMTHGETDAGDANYEAELYQLLTDYNTDIPAITGQTQKILLIVSQQQSGVSHTGSTLGQWKIGVDHPTEAVCSGPKYQYPYASDGVHLISEGYRQLGEKYGQVYYERVVMGRNWQPLQPTSAARSGQVISVAFHVPVPPLAWETSFSAPLPNKIEWQAGKGFEVRSSTARYTISSVAISGDSVLITCVEPLPDSGIKVGYAVTASTAAMAAPYPGTFAWGLLRDSDPFVGTATGVPQPNYAVSFEIDVP
jgi:hypothetical protein